MLIPQSNWKQTLPLFPWVSTLNRIYSCSEIPDLNGTSIYLASDYSGEHKQSKYNTITFLVFDLDKSTKWEYKRRIIRKRIFVGSRKMSFKTLNDLRRQSALAYFLEAANDFYGICTTFVISKKIKSLCFLPEWLGDFKDSAKLKANWNYKSLETAVRVTHFFCFLIAGLSHEKQDIYWISDEDSLFANMSYANDITNLASKFTSYYIKNPLGELGIGTTKLDEGDFKTEDITVLPDLVAGATAELATKIAQKYNGHIPWKMAYSLPSNLSKKTQYIIDWLTFDSEKLKKSVLAFDLYENNQLGVSRLLLE